MECRAQRGVFVTVYCDRQTSDMLLAVSLILLSHAAASPRSFKHVAPRVASRFFLRMNTKVDVVPYTAIFAYASGFRLNWDLRPTPSSPIFFVGQRAHLHDTISGALERYGLEGRDCIVRAFCELADIQHHTDIISNLLKVIFKAEENITCPTEHTCPISLISLTYLVYGKDHLLEE